MIEGVVIKDVVTFTDDRGSLAELWRSDDFSNKFAFDGCPPTMGYISFTKPQVQRGPHEHEHQTDFFVFIGPGNFAVTLWDNRPSSKTFGERNDFIFGEMKPASILIPKGVVHTYKNISLDKDGMVLNFPDRLYKGYRKQNPVDEIRHEDDPNTIFVM